MSDTTSVSGFEGPARPKTGECALLFASHIHELYNQTSSLGPLFTLQCLLKCDGSLELHKRGMLLYATAHVLMHNTNMATMINSGGLKP